MKKLHSRPVVGVPCPCCLKSMEPQMVVCWPCYRVTGKLTPGRGVNVDGLPSLGEIASWEQARQKRMGWATTRSES